MVKAVFLDRDGVLNSLIDRENGSKTAPWSIMEFTIDPYFHAAMANLKYAKYKRFVITNQPDILDGPMSFKDLHEINQILYRSVDEIFCALERDSKYYKPNNGMIEHFVTKYNIERTQSYLIGDRWKDIVAGNRSGIKTIYIGNEYSSPKEYEDIKPDFVASCLIDASELILNGVNNDTKQY